MSLPYFYLPPSYDSLLQEPQNCQLNIDRSLYNDLLKFDTRILLRNLENISE